MKRIIKKNQVIITSLVIMIVVAGYLNFTADESVTSPENQTAQAENGEDMLVDVDVAPEEDMAIVDAAAEGGDGTESAENADSAGAENGETENIDDVGSIGEAVLTSSQAAKGFSAAAKLNREQVRSQNKEMLMEIINDSAGDAAVKAEAADSLKRLPRLLRRNRRRRHFLRRRDLKILLSQLQRMVWMLLFVLNHWTIHSGRRLKILSNGRPVSGLRAL